MGPNPDDDLCASPCRVAEAVDAGYAPGMTDDRADAPAVSADPLALKSAMPSPMARAVALAVIVVGGLCGGLIGYAFVDLQCEGSCGTANGIGLLVGAIVAAAGVAVLVVLALRAMAEWHARA